MTHIARRRWLAVVAAVLVALGPAVAADASTWPSSPTGVHVVGATSTTLTVGANKATNALSYRVWASPNKADLGYTTLNKSRPARHSASSKTPQVTVTGLTYRSGPLYYRFATVNGTHRRLTDILTAYLSPAAVSPTARQVPSGAAYLTWPDEDVTGYQVQLSTDPTLLSGVTTYTLQGHAQSFTPPAMAAGTTYYARVRALNGSTRSPYSAVVSLIPLIAFTKPISVITANDLNANVHTYNGASIPPWLYDRRNAAAALYKTVNPDIVMAQEGGVLVSKTPPLRQVDTTANALGSAYTVAHTEAIPGSGSFRDHGVYIIYRNTRFEPVVAGSTIDFAPGKSAAFQVLREKSTGAEFLVATAHLIAGTDYSVRRQEVKDMLAEAQSIATAHGGIPIILGGCLHEARTPIHPADGPYSVLGAADFGDALTAAQHRSGADLNSFNNYQRPIRKGVAIDRIFVGPGVAATSWTMLLHRNGNQLAGVIPSDHNPVAATVLLPVVPGS